MGRWRVGGEGERDSGRMMGRRGRWGMRFG